MKRSFASSALLPLLVGVLGFGCTGQATLERHLERADKFFALSRFKEAIIEYQGVLRIQATNQTAIAQLGLAHFQTGDFERAFPFLKRAVETQPDRLDLKTKLAQVYLIGGAPEEALRHAAELLGKKPADLDALLVWADANLALGKLDDGLARLSAEEARHGTEPRYLLALGKLHLLKGDLPAAQSAMEEAIRLAPAAADGYLARGEVKLRQGNPAAARSDFLKAYELDPASPAVAIRWAKFNVSVGQSDVARKAIDQLLAKKPRFLPGLFERAVIDASDLRYDESLAGLKETLSLDPNHLPSLLMVVRIALLQGQIEEAAKQSAELVNRYPRSALVHLERGRVLLRQGQGAEAEKHLREAITLAPQMPEAALALAEIEIRSGRHAAAIGHLAPFLGPASPVRPSALLLAGAARRLAGDWDESLNCYRELAKYAPGSAEPLFLSALTCHAAGRREEAARFLQQALDADPAYVPALAGLVAIEVDQSRIDAALGLVDRQLQLKPDVPGIHYLRASLLARKGDLPAAEKTLLKVLALDPKVAAAYQDLGRLYVQQGRIPEALKKLGDAVAANPRDLSSQMMMGILHQQEKRTGEAMEVYGRILELDPRFVAALNNLAYLLAAENKDLDRALELAQRARELAPADPAIADTLGLVALKRKDYRWAQSLLEECANQMSGEPEVLHHLAQAYAGLGREEAARGALTRALASERDFPGRDEARAQLGILAIPLDQVRPEDEARLEEAYKREPGNPSTLVRLAALRQQQGKRSEALSLNEKAIESSPDFLPALINLTWLQVENPSQAVIAGRKARDLAPRDPLVAHALGWAAYRAADYPWARSLLSEAAADRPDDAEIQFHLAQATLMVGRVAESRREAGKAATGSSELSTRAASFLQLLDIYMGQQGSTAAAAIFAAARARDPQDPLLRIAIARTATGDAAIKQYETLVSTYPSWPLPMRDLAAIRLAADKADDETLRMAGKARELMPDDPTALRTHGLLLARNGATAQALTILQKVAGASPDDGLSLFWLAKCMAAQGAKPEAIAMMQRASKCALPDTLRSEAGSLVSQWQK